MEKKIFSEVTNYWNFAPFECFANAALSLLKLWNLDATAFFLQYWYLNYDKLLFSFKHPRLNHLDYYYGLEYNFEIASIDSMLQSLNEDAAVLLVCDTKNLSYYPKDYDGVGNFDLLHFVVVYGYNVKDEYFYVLDPTVDHIGILSFGEVDSLINELERGTFLRVKKSESSRPQADPIELFRRASRQSYLQYHVAEQTRGVKAIECFTNELMRYYEHGKDEKFDRWLYCNCISLTSIIKNRNAIWNSVRTLDFLPAASLERCESIFQGVIKGWTVLNFLTTKMRMKNDLGAIPAICDKLAAVRQSESNFLSEMYQVGMNL